MQSYTPKPSTNSFFQTGVLLHQPGEGRSALPHLPLNSHHLTILFRIRQNEPQEELKQK